MGIPRSPMTIPRTLGSELIYKTNQGKATRVSWLPIIEVKSLTQNKRKPL